MTKPDEFRPRRRGVAEAAAQNGSVMIVVVIGVTVLASIIAGTLLSVSTNYRTTVHAANWQESLLTAETGADYAMATLRKTISDPASSWAGWKTVDGNGIPLPNSGHTFALPSLQQHGGAGGSGALIQVDAPPALRDAKDQQWFRIRSSGSAALTGSTAVGSDKRDGVLRKLSLRINRKTGLAVATPEASRLIEVVARPSSFENAIVAQGQVAMNNYKVVVDSYDSTDPTKSTDGLYDEDKAQENGDVATNGQIVNAGGAFIHGDVLTNAGAGNVTGVQRTDYYQDLLPVSKPTWAATSSQPSFIDSTMTLTGGTKANPTRYKLGGITLTGGTKLTIAPSAPGVESYVELWVTGNINMSGSGELLIATNANVKIFVEGNVSIIGNGMVNEKQIPASLLLLGIAPHDGVTRTFTLSGNGAFTGAVYAPSHAVALSGGGSNGSYVGAIAAKTLTMSGNSSLHYDESLVTGDFITDYKIASWFEDTR